PRLAGGLAEPVGRLLERAVGLGGRAAHAEQVEGEVGARRDGVLSRLRAGHRTAYLGQFVAAARQHAAQQHDGRRTGGAAAPRRRDGDAARHQVQAAVISAAYFAVSAKAFCAASTALFTSLMSRFRYTPANPSSASRSVVSPAFSAASWSFAAESSRI